MFSFLAMMLGLADKWLDVSEKLPWLSAVFSTWHIWVAAFLLFSIGVTQLVLNADTRIAKRILRRHEIDPAILETLRGGQQAQNAGRTIERMVAAIERLEDYLSAYQHLLECAPTTPNPEVFRQWVCQCAKLREDITSFVEQSPSLTKEAKTRFRWPNRLGARELPPSPFKSLPNAERWSTSWSKRWEELVRTEQGLLQAIDAMGAALGKKVGRKRGKPR